MNLGKNFTLHLDCAKKNDFFIKVNQHKSDSVDVK